jgi:hypothetical protein
MRTTAVMGIIVVAISLVMGTRAEAQVSLRPGLYERVHETEAAGASGQHKDTLCMTPEDAKDVLKTIAAAGKETNCKVSDVKTAAARKLTFTMTCKDPDGVSTYTNDVTYGPDSYTNVSKGKTAHGTVSSKVTAKRIGECKK